MRLGEKHELKDGDVIKIVSTKLTSRNYQNFFYFLLRKASAIQRWHSSEPVRNPLGSFRSLSVDSL